MDSEKEEIDDVEGTFMTSSVVLTSWRSSSIIQFPDWFHKYSQLLQLEQRNSALYSGNISDLWGFFRKLMLGSSKGYEPIDNKIVRKLSTSSQIYFFSSSVSQSGYT